MSAGLEAYHLPVLLEEVIEGLALVPGGIYLDGTLGGGGHTHAILSRVPHTRVIGLDQDREAIETASRRLTGEFGERIVIRRSNYRFGTEVLSQLGIGGLEGALLDLGVSSRQLDCPARGFSFRGEGPLDMRMDDRQELDAARIVNTWPEEELIRIFREYGEERHAPRIAREIVARRRTAPLTTGAQLAEMIAGLAPKGYHRIHPATRVFQALRMAVNDELGALKDGLRSLTACLGPGGRLAVISFHSLEDRIVKHFMRHHAREFVDEPGMPQPEPNPEHCLELVTRKAVTAGEEECRRNPRARSAKLRIARKVTPTH
ncbi:MAG: 16S rRNA (cytosine(1402)-N(4))-methyltransferase RsmH [Verrucomicrobiae bacterium]|nr:16S rRNA (cytosine(1402)-N(4))-methyltransferase RsmH [Verrucomicrobiae bacterium]